MSTLELPVYPANDGWWDDADGYEPGTQHPPPATHWFWQDSGRWVAVRGESEADWFEDDTTEPLVMPHKAWPIPRSYPIEVLPPSGTLFYRLADGSEVEQSVSTYEAAPGVGPDAFEALVAESKGRLTSIEVQEVAERAAVIEVKVPCDVVEHPERALFEVLGEFMGEGARRALLSMSCVYELTAVGQPVLTATVMLTDPIEVKA